MENAADGIGYAAAGGAVRVCARSGCLRRSEVRLEELGLLPGTRIQCLYQRTVRDACGLCGRRCGLRPAAEGRRADLLVEAVS